MEEISYRLKVFEGPLDLLLHLIEINKIDIYDIPIAQITDQYLEYIHGMDFEDMDLASSFLVMAAELLKIKSRMLLPAAEEKSEEDEDPRAGLAKRLMEYKVYKYLAGKLSDMSVDAMKQCYKGVTIPDDLEYVPEPVDTAKLVENIGLKDLQDIFLDVMKRSFDRIDPVRSNFGKIKKEPVDYGKRSVQIRTYIRKKKRNISFRHLLNSGSSKDEIIVTFLVILEMMKDGTVHTRQDSLFDDIYIDISEQQAQAV